MAEKLFTWMKLQLTVGPQDPRFGSQRIQFYRWLCRGRKTKRKM